MIRSIWTVYDPINSRAGLSGPTVANADKINHTKTSALNGVCSVLG